jgi:Kef-type K+ transport system membrane component KefB
LLQLLLLLAVILLASKLAGWASVRLGQPAVFGKILVGLLLGPTLLDLLGWHVGGLALFAQPGVDPHSGPLSHTLRDMAELGVLLLMFLAGLETDIQQVRKVRRAAALAAVGGVLAPFGAAVAAALAFAQLGLPFGVYESIFIGTVLTATSVSISAQTLLELGMLRSKEGSAILGAAVLDDVIGIFLLSLVIAFKPIEVGTSVAPQGLLDLLMQGFGSGLSGTAAVSLRVFLLLFLMAAFFGLAVLSTRLLGGAIRRVERLPLSESLLSGVLIAGLLYAWAAQWIGGVAAITGTFVCGLLLGRTELKDDIEGKLTTLTYAFFLPVFLVGIGLQADARPIFAPLASPALMSREQWLLLAFTFVIITLAVLAKVWGCQVGARLGGFNHREALRVGVGMTSRGEVGLIIALVGLSAGIIDGTIFSIMVLLVLVTTLLTPIWLKAVFKGAPAAEPRVEPHLEA